MTINLTIPLTMFFRNPETFFALAQLMYWYTH